MKRKDKLSKNAGRRGAWLGRVLMVLLALYVSCLPMNGQERRPQHKPYIDLRPLHFGISVGMNFQDVEFTNIGPQTIVQEDGTETNEVVLCDQDNWNPGFSVGVLADMRLGKHLSARFSPTMHFGAKHLVFRHLTQLNAEGRVMESTQDLKNTYIAFPIDLKFSAERFNNYRPYIIGGINPMINLTGKAQDNIQLKRYDTFVEIGVGCDFYLPFFKLIPELKFSYSLMDAIDYDHVDELQDPNKRIYARSVAPGRSKMITLTFYFE